MKTIIQEPRYLATIFSLLLSVIVFFHHQPLNLDGIIYLTAAETFLQQGFKAALAVYAWPLYPILIASISAVTHLSLLTSAYLLNTLFATSIVVTFITLCKELGASRRTQYFAALVILLYPYLNHYRDEVIRDYGYYTFLLFSLLQFIRYLRTTQFSYALLWGVTITMASLFRIEGIFIQCLVPFAVFIPVVSLNQRLKLFCQLNAVTLLLATLALIAILASHHHLNELGRLKEIFDFASQFFTNIHNKLLLLQQTLFPTFGQKAIPSFFGGGVFTLFIFYFIKACGLLYTCLAGFALRHKLMSTSPASQFAVAVYCVINILILSTFAVQQLFLTGRYLAPLCLLVMLYVPFALDYLLNQVLQKQSIISGQLIKNKWVVLVITAWLFLLGVDSLFHTGPSKTYVVNAGNWLANNTTADSRVFSNDAQLMYYSKRVGLKYPKDFTEGKVPFSTLVNQPWQDYDYLALVISRKQRIEAEKILALIKTAPLAIFVNHHGDKAMLFKIAKGNKNYVYTNIRN